MKLNNKGITLVEIVITFIRYKRNNEELEKDDW